jgi:hypothetical protein
VSRLAGRDGAERQAIPWRELADLGRRSAGLPWFLRRRLGIADAAAAVAERVRRREARLLRSVERLVFGVERSPLRRLLAWAGCEAGDLRRMVAADGVEAALARLHAAGVFVSADEFRGRVALVRSGLQLAVEPRDFDNPLISGGVGGAGGVAGATSGTTGRGVPVRYSWRFLAAEAADEALLLHSHGLAAAPLAFWLPGPPGIAGLHNLLVHAKLGGPPQRWYSPSPAPVRSDGLAFWADRGWRAARRSLSVLGPALGPAPEWLPLEDAAEIARWLAASRRPGRPAVLKCFASAALRVAGAAAAAGIDLSGNVVLAGGEPLTERRRDFLARAGLRVYGRYAATETGFVAGACPLAADGGDMHLYGDRLAVIAAGGGAAAGGGRDQGDQGALAFTSLSLAAPKVLLNVEIGDHGMLRRRPCDCLLGQAGLVWRVSEVHSPAKVAAEGVKLGDLELASLVEAAVIASGGSPDDFQIWLDESESGASRLTVALAPQAAVDLEALRRGVRERLPSLAGGALAVKLWLDAGVLAVERRALRHGPGGKMRRVVRVEPTETAGEESSDAL